LSSTPIFTSTPYINGTLLYVFIACTAGVIVR